jgi:hypothetical protein
MFFPRPHYMVALLVKANIVRVQLALTKMTPLNRQWSKIKTSFNTACRIDVFQQLLSNFLLKKS